MRWQVLCLCSQGGSYGSSIRPVVAYTAHEEMGGDARSLVLDMPGRGGGVPTLQKVCRLIDIVALAALSRRHGDLCVRP